MQVPNTVLDFEEEELAEMSPEEFASVLVSVRSEIDNLEESAGDCYKEILSCLAQIENLQSEEVALLKIAKKIREAFPEAYPE